MSAPVRVLLAVWLLLGWTPHGVCVLQFGAKQLFASQPVSEGCPLCHKTIDADIRVSPCPGMPGSASPTSTGVPSRNAPSSPPGKCCSPDAGVTSGSKSASEVNQPICWGYLWVPCAAAFSVAVPSVNVLGGTQSCLNCPTVPLHLRLCVLLI